MWASRNQELERSKLLAVQRFWKGTSHRVSLRCTASHFLDSLRMKLLRTLAVLLLLPAAVVAQEDEEDPDAPPDFDELLGEIDENKDGKISWEEMFGSDADVPDGEEGMPADIKDKYQAVYKECDSDGDGLINREELPTLFSKLTAMEEEEGMHDEKDEV